MPEQPSLQDNIAGIVSLVVTKDHQVLVIVPDSEVNNKENIAAILRAALKGVESDVDAGTTTADPTA